MESIQAKIREGKPTGWDEIETDRAVKKGGSQKKKVDQDWKNVSYVGNVFFLFLNFFFMYVGVGYLFVEFYTPFNHLRNV